MTFQSKLWVSCDGCGKQSPALRDKAEAYALRDWVHNPESVIAHMCPDCAKLGEETLKQMRQAQRGKNAALQNNAG